ncbi:uncharacterized protein LOC100908530 [Galendromus occidentalis]|uniref:Uncharacterized protein LOC100908530 n=1 Tax=Galendromus occidentalis TaxID=34638 RepID=A0AAJ6VUJ7_9ACAR|nr:uncharacterized protein LOC100908530 [Galendromus occidentalis]
MTTKYLSAAFVWLLCSDCSDVICQARMKMNQVVNDVPLIKGYSDFSMKQLDGFQGISLELNFLDGELNFEVTRDNYALIEDDVIKVTSHEVSDDEDEDPIIVVPLQRISETNFFRFQRNPSSGEFLVGFKPNSFLVMMHPRNGRDLRAFVCIGKEFLECDGDTIVRYLRRFEGLESLSIDFQKRTAKLKL